MSEPGAHRPWFVAVAVAAVAALWVGVAVNSLAAGQPGPKAAATRSAAPTPQQSHAPTPSPRPTRAPPEVEAVVEELQDFVEQHHRLRFANDVKVQVLDDEAFQRALADADTTPNWAREIQQATYIALGLLDPGNEPSETDAGFDDRVAGFYDDDADALFVRGNDLTPFVRGVLVHELTHALQYHNFTFESGPQELVDPLRGLLEGGATWTESAYYDSLSTDEQRAYDDEADRRFGTPSTAPPGPPDRLSAFPYEVGEDFVEELVEGDNEHRLAAAYERPPTTSEQLLYRKAYERREQAKQVLPPDDDHRPLDHGALGEAGLRVVLAEHISDEVAEGAARGWGGDRYRLWRQLAEICIRINFAMDTPRDSAELRRAFDSYADKRPGTKVSSTKVSGDEILTVTMCAPE